MYVSMVATIGSLALLQGAAPHSLFSDRGIALSQRQLNSTTTFSGSERPTAIQSQCTTIVTSILGEKFAPSMGSCSHTLTFTSTIQPIESKTQTIVPESTSSILSTSKQSLASSASANPSTNLQSLSFTTPSTKSEETSVKSPLLSSPSTSQSQVECVTTVTSILGEFLGLGSGSCSRTVTVISTTAGSSISLSTSSIPFVTGSATSSSETQTPISVSLSTSGLFTPTTVIISSTSINTPGIPLPEPCTATITSTLGKPLAPFQGSCSQTVTVVTTSMQVSPPQGPSSSEQQPPLPVITSVNSNKPPPEPMSTSTTMIPVLPSQQTELGGTDVGPVITTPRTTLIIPTTMEQLPQPTIQSLTSLTPTAPLSSSAVQPPQLPNKPSTSPPPVPTEVPSSTADHTIQSPLSTSSKEPVSPSCTTGCNEPQPTNLPISVPNDSSAVPIQSSIATESQVTQSSPQQVPTTTQLSGSSTTGELSTPLATPSPPIPPIPIITNTPTPGVILIGSQTITQDTASNFVLGSQTLVPGSAITVNGQQVSAASGGAIIINPAPPKATPSSSDISSSGPAPAVVVVDGTSFTGNTASGFVVGTQTLFPGSAITASGQVITLPPQTPTPAPAPTQTQLPDTIPVILIGSSTFTQNSASAFIIGSQTLSPGSAVTISGQVISLSPTGNAVIVNGATATRNPTTFSTEIQAPITSVVVAGQTLTAGGQVTVGGDVLSLSGGTITIIGTVTVGGEAVTATATPTGKKKSAGLRLESYSPVYIAVHMLFVFGMVTFGLF